MFGPRVPDPDPGPNQILKVAFLPQNLNEIDLKRNAYTFDQGFVYIPLNVLDNLVVRTRKTG